MTIVKSATLRRWARRSLLIAAILGSPAAYSEVVSDNPPTDDEGTLLGNYLSGRLARGDHHTEGAAGVSPPRPRSLSPRPLSPGARGARWPRHGGRRRFLFQGPRRRSRQRDHSRAGFPARSGLGPLRSRHRARQPARADRAVAPHRPVRARLRGIQEG